MKELYILIITSYLNFKNEEIPNIPSLEIVSSHYSFKSCDDDIVETHDYYLAKDIRRKSTKQRKSTLKKAACFCLIQIFCIKHS